jgi:hypothetical protein
MFQDTRVLIAEDDGTTALDLALSVQDAGGEVVGPVPTAAGALALLETMRVDAAILDTRLFDRDVTPVALQLLSRNVPILIYSGLGLPAAFAERHPQIPVLLKPTPASRVVKRLAALRKLHLKPVDKASAPARGASDQTRPIAFFVTTIGMAGGSREGRSAYADGKLVGILIPVTPEEAGDGSPGGWYLEAGFGPCGPLMAATPPVFADLGEAAAWFSKMLARSAG